jgi:transposase
MASHKKYSAEFKRQAVELAKTSGKSYGEIEHELGITAGLQADRAEAFPENGRLKESDEELRRLRRELEIVTQERDILKKRSPSSRQKPVDEIRVYSATRRGVSH